MNKGLDAPVDLDVLCKEASKAIHDEEALLCEIRQHIDNTELMFNLKAENRTDTIRGLIVKIKVLWEKYCE